MSESILFFCNKMAVGGTETLILRLLKWYSEHGLRVILLTIEPIVDNALLQDINEIERLECYVIDNKTSEFVNKENLRLELSESEIVYVNTQFFPEFFKCFVLLNFKYKCQFKFSIYIVHYYSAYMSRVLALSFGKILMKRLIDTNKIFFMDEETARYSLSFYKLASLNSYVTLRLPIQIHEFEHFVRKNEKFNILAIARYEFPFKGYLLGLIEAFKKIKAVRDDVSLTIIGYGEGELKLRQKILELPSEIKSDVTLVGKVQYSCLQEYINRSNVYVGMGTTILDVANHNKVCIVVPSYQETESAHGFFHDNHSVLGSVYDSRYSYKLLHEMILSLMSLSKNEYYELECISKQKLRDYYDIDKIAPFLINKKLSQFTLLDTLLLRSIIVLNHLIFFVNKILNRN